MSGSVLQRRSSGRWTPGAQRLLALGLAILPVVHGFLRAATTPGGRVENPLFLDHLYTYAWFAPSRSASSSTCC